MGDKGDEFSPRVENVIESCPDNDMLFENESKGSARNIYA